MSYIYVTDVKIVVCTIADNSFLSTAESRDFLKLGFGCCSVACQCFCAINYRILVFKFEMCNFLFGTQTLIYQKTTKGVVGGGFGMEFIADISVLFLKSLLYHV